MSSLAHRLVFGSDTICNSQILTDIVLFELSLLGFLSKFQTSPLERGSEFQSQHREEHKPDPSKSKLKMVDELN